MKLFKTSLFELLFSMVLGSLQNSISGAPKEYCLEAAPGDFGELWVVVCAQCDWAPHFEN